MGDQITYSFLNFNGATVEVSLGMDKLFHPTLYRGMWLFIHDGIKVNPI